jgi:hypothetical protein
MEYGEKVVTIKGVAACCNGGRIVLKNDLKYSYDHGQFWLVSEI